MEQDGTIPEATWDAWNRLLSPAAQLRLSATRTSRGAAARHDVTLNSADDEAKALFELATELRDRLRFSQRQLTHVKQELAATRETAQQQLQALMQQATQQQASLSTQAVQQQAALAALADADRQSQAQILSGFEAEILRLSQGVTEQAAALDSQQAAAQHMQQELAEAQAQAQAARAQAQAAEEMAARAQHDRAAADERVAEAHRERQAALEELEELRAAADDALNRAAHHQQQHVDAMGALLAAKNRFGELHQVDALYKAARDELDRMERENTELRHMVAGGVGTLGRSRILETLTPTKHKSKPMHLSPRQAAAATQGFITLGPAAAIATGSALRSGDGHRTGAEELPGLAWLGPPSSAYPADPEKFVYLRVAGGYKPKYVGTEEQPKASGWIPKDVVRLVQAFRHAYGLGEPEWEYWEPLLLLVDEVYRGAAGTALSTVHFRSQDKLQSMKRQLQSAVSYPSVLQAGRIAYLKRHLETMRKSLHAKDGGNEHVLKRLMEKEYHLTNQLDTAVDENAALRRSLRQLDELYSADLADTYAPSPSRATFQQRTGQRPMSRRGQRRRVRAQ